MKHSVFLICRNVPNYSSYLTTKDTDFSKKNVEYWSLDREKATVFFLNRPQKNIFNSIPKNCLSIQQRLYTTQTFSVGKLSEKNILTPMTLIGISKKFLFLWRYICEIQNETC